MAAAEDVNSSYRVAKIFLSALTSVSFIFFSNFAARVTVYRTAVVYCGLLYMHHNKYACEKRRPFYATVILLGSQE